MNLEVKYVTNLKVSKGDELNKNSVVFELVDNSYYVFTTIFHYNAENLITVGDSVTMMVSDVFNYIDGTVSKVSDLKQHYSYGGEIQEVEIRVKNPGYTLEGITVSQITITTQSGAKIMALDDGTFETPKSVNYKCPSSGKVVELNINEGSYISPDTLIMVLENEDLYENLSEAKSSLSDALTELADIKDDSSFYTITAPIDGVVTSVPVKERRERARKDLERVGLGARVDHKPTELSGGQQQRVAIARALITNPPLILADEPTGNLDSTFGKEIMEIFRKLNANGNTIVLITHDNGVDAQAKRIIRIQDGKLTEVTEV